MKQQSSRLFVAAVWLLANALVAKDPAFDDLGCLRFFPRWFVSAPLPRPEVETLLIHGGKRPCVAMIAEDGKPTAVVVPPDPGARKAWQEQCAKTLHEAGIIERVDVLWNAGTRFLRSDLGILIYTPSVGLLLVVPDEGVAEVVNNDVEVSCLTAAGQVVFAAGRVTTQAGEQSAILIIGSANGVTSLRRLIRIPSPVMALSQCEKDQLFALGERGLYRVELPGTFKLMYGTIGLPPLLKEQRITWLGRSPNSLVQVDGDFIIGTDYGLVLLMWSPAISSYDELWLFPPDDGELLLDIKGFQRLP